MALIRVSPGIYRDSKTGATVRSAAGTQPQGTAVSRPGTLPGARPVVGTLPGANKGVTAPGVGNNNVFPESLINGQGNAGSPGVGVNNSVGAPNGAGLNGQGDAGAPNTAPEVVTDNTGATTDPNAATGTGAPVTNNTTGQYQAGKNYYNKDWEGMDYNSLVARYNEVGANVKKLRAAGKTAAADALYAKQHGLGEYVRWAKQNKAGFLGGTTGSGSGDGTGGTGGDDSSGDNGNANSPSSTGNAELDALMNTFIKDLTNPITGYEDRADYRLQNEKGAKQLAAMMASRGLSGSGAEIGAETSRINELNATEQTRIDGLREKQQNTLQTIMQNESLRKEREKNQQFDNVMRVVETALSQSPATQGYDATGATAKLTVDQQQALSNWIKQNYQKIIANTKVGGGSSGSAPTLDTSNLDLSGILMNSANKSNDYGVWGSLLSGLLGSK
jgi:hypothetical protein